VALIDPRYASASAAGVIQHGFRDFKSDAKALQAGSHRAAEVV
jgi:hypothetical protein